MLKYIRENPYVIYLFACIYIHYNNKISRNVEYLKTAADMLNEIELPSMT